MPEGALLKSKLISLSGFVVSFGMSRYVSPSRLLKITFSQLLARPIIFNCPSRWVGEMTKLGAKLRLSVIAGSLANLLSCTALMSLLADTSADDCALNAQVAKRSKALK